EGHADEGKCEGAITRRAASELICKELLRLAGLESVRSGSGGGGWGPNPGEASRLQRPGFPLGKKRPACRQYPPQRPPNRSINFSSSMRVRATSRTSTAQPVTKRNQFAVVNEVARTARAQQT